MIAPDTVLFSGYGIENAISYVKYMALNNDQVSILKKDDHSIVVSKVHFRIEAQQISFSDWLEQREDTP